MNEDLPLCAAPHCGSVVRRGYSRCSRCLLSALESDCGEDQVAAAAWLAAAYGVGDSGE